jgi:hypothetical protein
VAKGGEPRTARKLEAVERLIGNAEEGDDGAEDR